MKEKRDILELFSNQIHFTPKSQAPTFFFRTWVHPQTRKIPFWFGKKQKTKTKTKNKNKNKIKLVWKK